MPLGSGASLAVGVATGGVVVGALLTIAFASKLTPPVVTTAVPATGAWVWTPPAALKFVPFASPIVSPDLHRAADGSVFVESGSGGAPEAFDPASSSFVPLSTSPKLEQPPETNTGESARLLTGKPKTWICIAYDNKTRIMPSGARLQERGTAGPALPASWQPEVAIAEDGRLVLVTDTKLFVAKEHDAEFTEVALRPPLGNYVVAAAGAGGPKVLLVVSPSQQGGGIVPDKNIFSTRFIDVDSGEATPGPELPGPLSGKLISGNSVAWLDDGSMLLAASERRTTSSANRSFLPILAGALSVVFAASGGFASLYVRRRLVRDRALLGLVVGAVLSGVLLVALFFLAVLATPPR